MNVPPPVPPRRLALYKYDACPFCRRVQLALDDLELEVEMRDVLFEPKHRTELMNRTGRTQVPCLFIDDEPLFESADIVDWLTSYAANVQA